MTFLNRKKISLSCIAIAFFATSIITDSHAANEYDYQGSDLQPLIVESETLDVLTLNIAHGRGLSLNQIFVSTAQHRDNLREVSSLLRDSGAQIVAVQEADGESLWSGRFDHVAYLAEIADYPSYVHGYHANSWLFTYGAGLMSKFRLSEVRSHRFQPSWPTATKGFVLGTVLWRDDQATPQAVTLASVHLDFSRESIRQAQIAELADELRIVDTPVIILGDFNGDWSEENSPVRKLARKLNLQAFDPTKTGIGTYKKTQRLDWILISNELKFQDYRVLPHVVSDHLAVLATIGWSSPN